VKRSIIRPVLRKVEPLLREPDESGAHLFVPKGAREVEAIKVACKNLTSSSDSIERRPRVLDAPCGDGRPSHNFANQPDSLLTRRA
jgi:hypothetical protein